MKKNPFDLVENDLVWTVVEETFAKEYAEIKQTEKNSVIPKKRKKQTL
jgi:hypothetical protein